MADMFGMNDYSGLSGTQADTARSIQRTFDASLASRARALERFSLQTSGPMLQEFGGDMALKRAQTTAGILNNNEQLQHMIDASHRTPHGLMQNLAAYGPGIASLARLYPALFGTNDAAGLSRNGIIPSAYKGIQNAYHYFTDPRTGQTYPLDAQGNVVPYGMGDHGIGPDQFGNAAATGPVYQGNYGPQTDWGPGYPSNVPDFNFDAPAQTAWNDFDPNMFNFGGA